MGYRAFLSYSRADDKMANWLHRSLDRYRTPKALIGMEGEQGPVPPKLFPIFRDRTDLEAGGHVNGALQGALEESESLIVLCTPASAKSRWVEEECQTFLRLGRESRIFPVIAQGEPDSGDPETECFPPALQGKGLLAADLREIRLPTGRLIGDGRDGGRLKLIAGLLGVPLDALARRERQRQRSRTVAASAAAAIFGIVALIAVFQTFEQIRQRSIAVTERDRAEFSVARFITERGWAALQGNNAITAARYALLAGRQMPERSALAGEVIARIRREAIVPLAELAAGGRTVLAFWSGEDPRVVRQVAGRALEGWSLGPQQKLLFTHPLAEGESVCAASSSTALVCGLRGLKRSVSLQDGAVLAQFADDGEQLATPVISMNGERALSLSDGHVRVWDVRTGALLESPTFSLDGGGDFQLALSGAGNVGLIMRTQGPIVVWHLGAPQQLQRFPEMLSSDVTCRMATPTAWTGQFEIGCESAEGFEDIRIDLTATGYQVSSDPVLYGAHGAGPGNMFGHPEPILTGPSFAQRSPSGAVFYRDLITRGETRSPFVTLDGDGATVRLYPSGRVVLAPQGLSEREIVFGGLAFAELSPDRRAVLMAGENGEGRVYSLAEISVSPLATGQFSDFERSQPRGPVFSPDGRYVAAMRNVDSEILVVDVENRRSLTLSTFDESDEMFAGVRAQNGVDRILFAEGRIFASTIDGETIHAWNVATPSRREELPVAANGELVRKIRESGLELLGDQRLERPSPDGRFKLRPGLSGDVLLQSRRSGFTLAGFESIQRSPLKASAFSADGLRLATLSARGDIAVWDLSSLGKSFDQGAAWVCAHLLSKPDLRHFSEAEIANDPLLQERGVDARLDLCAP